MFLITVLQSMTICTNKILNKNRAIIFFNFVFMPFQCIFCLLHMTKTRFLMLFIMLMLNAINGILIFLTHLNESASCL